MLPRAAEVLRNRIRGGNLGLRGPRSIISAGNALFAMFGGKVPLRPAVVKPGTKPYSGTLGSIGFPRHNKQTHN